MNMKKLIFAVIEANQDSSVSGWYFTNINEANAFAEKMNNANLEDYKFIVITLAQGQR